MGTFACLFSQSILNETLKDLSEKFILNQLVIEDTLFYSFAIPLMREWIKETMNDPLPIISHNSIHLLQGLPLGQFSRLNNQLKKQNKEDFFLSTLHFAENKWGNLVKFSKIWSEILEDRKKDFGQRTDKNRVNTIVQSFADLFDFSIDTIKSHALMDYCKFKTMPSVLKRLRNIVLIIPTVEKTDESFYESVIELIIDQDDVSSVFLIIEFADSPGFIKQCRRSRLDLVLLFEREMKEVLFSQNYLQALQEKVILKRVDLVQFSPYMVNMPVEGRMFFGRHTEIKRVEHKSQKNFAIVAARQAGKTSLLRKLKSRIVDSKNVKTLYLDCEIYSDPANNMSRLCTDILKGLSLVKTSVKDINEFRSILEKNCQTKNSKL